MWIRDSRGFDGAATAYTIRAQVKQGVIFAQLVGQSVSIQTASVITVTASEPGLYSDKTGVKFDDFKVFPGWRRDSLVPRIAGVADASISAGALSVTGTTRGGEAVVGNFEDDYYMVSADVAITGSNKADLFVHYVDPNNTYKVHMDISSVPAGITLYKVIDGAETSLASGTYTSASSVAVKIKIYNDLGSQRIKVWVAGALKLNTTDASLPAGGVAFGGVVGIDNLKIGYDNNADDDIDDAGDDLAVNETFASTSVTVTHDDAGNLIDDGVFVYQYDAWNRLVLIRSSVDADITIQTAEFDGDGR